MRKSIKSTTKFAVRYLMIFLILVVLLTANVNAVEKTLTSRKSAVSLINTISGTIFDQQRNPVVNIFVELQDDLYRSVSRVRTDGSGRYTFAGMRDGRYVIRVIASQFAFEEQIVEVEVVNFNSRPNASGIVLSGSDNVQKDIYMRLKRNSVNNDYTNGVVFAQEVPKNAQLIYDKAILLNDQNADVERVKLLEQAVSLFPNYFTALNRLGYEYFKKENFAKAAQNLAKAVDVNPKSEPTMYLLSYSLYLGKNYDAVIAVSEQAITIHDSSPRLRTIYGGSLRLKKKFKQAEEQLKKAETLDQKYPEVHWQLALLYGNDLNKFGEAANQLETFLKLQPNSKDMEKIKTLIQKFRQKEKGE